MLLAAAGRLRYKQWGLILQGAGISIGLMMEVESWISHWPMVEGMLGLILPETETCVLSVNFGGYELCSLFWDPEQQAWKDGHLSWQRWKEKLELCCQRVANLSPGLSFYRYFSVERRYIDISTVVVLSKFLLKVLFWISALNNTLKRSGPASPTLAELHNHAASWHGNSVITLFPPQ